ncbi:uncharacterized protein LOC134832419 [Culicoides brevitarsis]|uniref:uncharacterized protein LOC134832419 n=1 Tax=Culicoides brevitarsis TaxID=469753 RepID=UPI00307C487D
MVKINIAKIWEARGHLKIEAATFFLMVPGFLMMICIPVFELEKACRVNLDFDTEICDNLNNPRYKEICQTMSEKSKMTESKYNLTEEEVQVDYFNFLLLNETEAIDIDELALIRGVCHAEKESQKLLSKLYAYRAPIATTFTLIIVMFAGAWSDKYQIRKPFMLVPFLGEVVTIGIFLVSALYMEQIPADYCVLGAHIIPALTGGPTLFMIGASSYMTVTTKEDQRTFRFGCFSMFITILGIIGSPLSGPLFKALTFVQFFSFTIALFCIGALFVYIFIHEVTAEGNSKETSDVVITKSGVIVDRSRKSEDFVIASCKESSSPSDSKSIKKMILDFFDPTLIKSSVEVIKKSRPGNTKTILLCCILCQTLFFATHGEQGLILLFARTALNWTTEFGMFVMLVTTVGLLGTLIVTVVFVNWLHLHDATLGIISIIGTVVAKPIIAFSKTEEQMYYAIFCDMFGHARYIAIKSMISKIVQSEELGRVYSILGVSDNLDLLVVAPIYSLIYYQTIETLPGAIFLFSEVWLVAGLVLFIIIRILSRNTILETKNEETENPEEEEGKPNVYNVTPVSKNVNESSMNNETPPPKYEETPPNFEENDVSEGKDAKKDENESRENNSKGKKEENNEKIEEISSQSKTEESLKVKEKEENDANSIKDFEALKNID